MKKLSNTEAGLKKSVAYKKAGISIFTNSSIDIVSEYDDEEIGDAEIILL